MCIQKEKAVLCEKALTINGEEAREIVDLSFALRTNVGYESIQIMKNINQIRKPWG